MAPSPDPPRYLPLCEETPGEQEWCPSWPGCSIHHRRATYRPREARLLSLPPHSEYPAFCSHGRSDPDSQRRSPHHRLRLNTTRGRGSGTKALPLPRTNTPLRLSHLLTYEICGDFRGQVFADRRFVLLLVTRYEPDLHCNTRSNSRMEYILRLACFT